MTSKWPLTDSDYRAALGVSQSVLKGFKKCPRYVQWLENQSKKPPTASQALGLLTEHRLFGTAFKHVVSIYDSFRTNESKAWKLEQQSLGNTVITQDQVQDAELMVSALLENPDVTKLLSKGRASVGLFANDERTGLLTKGLLDWIPDTQFVCDLKTAADASPFGFGRAVAEYRYDVQAAKYTRLFRQVFNEDRRFAFFVVQNKEPFLTATYTLRPEQIDIASDQLNMWLDRYAECQRTGRWPSYTQGITVLDVPKYVQIPVEPL